jgi:hypothetical protein
MQLPELLSRVAIRLFFFRYVFDSNYLFEANLEQVLLDNVVLFDADCLLRVLEYFHEFLPPYFLAILLDICKCMLSKRLSFLLYD